VIVLDAELSGADEAALGATNGALVLLATVPPAGLRNAELILPVTTMAEENGVYVNRDGRAQRFQQAKAPPGMARPGWWIAGEVLAGPGPDADAPATADQAFGMLGRAWPVFAGLTHASLGFTGRVLADRAPAPAGVAG
jgi:NADH-quinone oxidoreductase subunit G